MKKVLSLLIASVMLLAMTISVSADAGDAVTQDVNINVVRPAWDVIIEPLSFNMQGGVITSKLPVLTNNMTDPVCIKSLTITPITGWTVDENNGPEADNSKKISMYTAWVTSVITLNVGSGTVTPTANSLGNTVPKKTGATAGVLNLNDNVGNKFMEVYLAKDSSFPTNGSMKIAEMTIVLDWA